MKWIVLGTGPTFFDPRKTRRWRDHRVITLNRAISGVEETDFAAIAHRATLEATKRHLCKARRLLLSDPFDTDPGRVCLKCQWRLLVWAPRPHNKRVLTFPRRLGVPRLDEILAGPPGYNLCHERTIAALAFSWLRQQGVTKIYTAGMDATGNIADSFRPLYDNLPPEYGWDPSIPQFLDGVCYDWGIETIPIEG